MKYKKMKKVFAGILSAVITVSAIDAVFAENGDDLVLRYDFSSDIEQGTAYGVTIEDGCGYFDGSDDYIHMPDNIVSGCENASFVINVRPDMDGANQFTFTIGNNENNYLFLNTNNGKNLRFAMTNVGWWQEEGEMTAESVQKGNWASVVIVMEGKTKRMYVNGELVSETTSELLASSLGNTVANYIAKSQYSADAYFKGYIDDFRIYSKALNNDEISIIAEEHRATAKVLDVYIASKKLEFDTYQITDNITLPTMFEGMKVEWASDKENVISNEGVVTRFAGDTWVNLTATFSDENGNKATRVYEFMVIHAYQDAEFAQMDLDSIHLVGNLKHLKEDLYLPTESKYGSKLTWLSMDDDIINSKGEITRLPSGEGSRTTKLYLMATYNGKTLSREYEITVEEEDFAYLFAYFTGNQSEQERMFYGLSRDGYNFNTINNGNTVLESWVGKKCLRDPYIMQGQNGKYYCIVTDMHSTEAPEWANQSSIIIFESSNLINWQVCQHIDFKQFSGWEKCNRAWAPQAIWDPEYYNSKTGEYGAYMIYLALSVEGGGINMYKIYSTDLTDLISEPELLYVHAEGENDIDSDIIYKDGMYYMYVKDETYGGKTQNKVFVVTSEHAGGPYSARINALPAKDPWGNDVGIEGSAIYKRMNEDKYNLVYDAFNNGFFIMTETEDMVNFNQLDRRDYSFDFTPRHGYVITISKAEVDKLEEAYGKSIAERIAAKKNPIIYYDFEDGRDKSGNFNDAQLTPSATIAQGISGGQGLRLDGTSESYATIPSDALSGLEDYTISAWIKPDVKNNTQRVFDFGTGTGRYMFLTPYYGANHLRGAITAGSYDYEKGVSIDVDIETGRWTHLVMMQEGDTMRIYIDGVLMGEEENIKLDPYEIKYTIPYCYIGKSMWSGDKYFDGTIDEFMIYDRAISDEEVVELFEKEILIACNIEETEDEYIITFVQDGEDIESFDAVICQYNEDGIMVNAQQKDIDFTENGLVTVNVEKVGINLRVFYFESMESLRPLN